MLQEDQASPGLPHRCGGRSAGRAASCLLDRLTDRLVSENRSARERNREDSAHKMADRFCPEIWREPSETGDTQGQDDLRRGLRVMWGLIHAGLRENSPLCQIQAAFPLPWPFFLACTRNGPLLGSRGMFRNSLQGQRQEIGNHIAWALAAETSTGCADFKPKRK